MGLADRAHFGVGMGPLSAVPETLIKLPLFPGQARPARPRGKDAHHCIVPQPPVTVRQPTKEVVNHWVTGTRIASCAGDRKNSGRISLGFTLCYKVREPAPIQVPGKQWIHRVGVCENAGRGLGTEMGRSKSVYE